MIYVLLAVLSGFSIIISRILNANMALKIGIYQGTLFNYIMGLSLSLILLLVMPGGFKFSHGVPFWAYLGGSLGVLVVMLSSYVTHRVSNFDVTLLTFIGQLVSGVAIDLLLGNVISTTKIIGGSILFIGLFYNILVDRQDNKKDPLPAQ